MNKTEKFKIFFAASLFALFANVFFGRGITARLSTVPVLNRLGILSPQAPLIVNKREEIRITDGGELEAALANENRLAALVVLGPEGELPKISSGALSLTSDGWFASAGVKLLPDKKYGIISTGKYFEAKEIVTDSKTGLVFAKVDAGSMPFADFLSPLEIKAGDKIFFGLKDTPDAGALFWQTQVLRTWPDAYVLALPAEKARPNLEFMGKPEGLIFGQTVFGGKGRVMGIWDGQRIVDANEISVSFNRLLKTSGKFNWPFLGFSYRKISKVFGKAEQTGQFEITEVQKDSPAFKAGLVSGDVLLTLNPYEIFSKAEPGVSFPLKVLRNGKEVELSLVPSVFK